MFISVCNPKVQRTSPSRDNQKLLYSTERISAYGVHIINMEGLQLLIVYVKQVLYFKCICGLKRHLLVSRFLLSRFMLM